MASQGKGARNKGARFERYVAEQLSLWVYNEPGKFHRVPMSGGLGWAGNVKAHGDIVSDDDNFPFVVECKNQEGWDLLQLHNRKGKLWNFVQQAMEEGEAAKKDWLLVIKRNQISAKVLFNMEALAELELNSQVLSIKSSCIKQAITFIYVNPNEEEYVIGLMELNDFFDQIKIPRENEENEDAQAQKAD